MSLYDELLAKQQNSVNAVKNLQTDVKDLAPLAQQYSGVQQNLTPYQKSPSPSTGNSVVNIAKETFSIGKTVLGKAGNFVLHTPEYVYQDMKPFLQATADVVTFKFQSEMENITKQTMQLDAISAKYDKMFSSGQMGKEQYLRLKQDLATSYDDLSKQSTALTKQAAQEGNAKKIATSAAMTAFDILSVGRYQSLKATTPIVKTGGVVSKSMSEGTFNALSKLTATVESAFQKIPSVRELMVRNAKYFAAVESKQLLGESALQFTGRELKNAAVGLILKRPIVYEMNVGLVKDTYDDIVNRNWNNGIQDGVVSDAAWLALQAVGGGPVKWISDHFGKTAQAVKKWSKGTPSLIDEISRRIGTKEADQIAKKLADGTLDNDLWQKIAAINLHMTDGDVARAASNILGNFEAGMDMTRVTPEYLEKNFKNWKTAFDIGTELEQKAIKAGKESKYVAVRWDAHSKYVFAKQAEQVINSSTDIEDIIRKLTALLDQHDFGQVDTLRNELLALYKPAMSGADYAKAVKKIVTATNTKVMKNISVKLKKQLDATGYLLAEVKNRITPAEGEYDIKKLVTAYSSGKELFDEAVNPVPVFAAVSNVLKRFGLSPEASNRVAYQRLSESFAENLSQLQGATDLGLKEQDAKQGAKFIISRLQSFIDEQRPSRGLNVLTLNKNKQSALQDIRQMYTKEIAQALHISEESAKKVKGAILKAYTDVPMELRGLGTKLVDYAYKVPMVPEMYRIQSALRYTYNPFFRSQEVIETKLLSHMKANNLVWMKSKKTLDEAWAKLDNTELFTGAYTGQAAQDLTLGRMHANLLPTQRRDLAGLALDIAEKKGVSLDYMLQKSPEELIDALKVIVQYPTKGPLNSPLARTLNIAFFPMRYNLKVADMVAKEVSKLPATVQTAFIHSMFKFSDWLQSNEGIQWQSDNADVIGLFKYFTPYGNLESVFSTLNKGLNRTMPNSIGELGLLGGLPFGFISQMIDAQGNGSLGPFKFDTPYVNQKTGEVLPDYIPVTLRGRAAVAIQTLLGSLFTYPGRIIGLPGKSSLIRKQVDVFLNTKSSDYIKNYRTEDLTPVQQKWVNLLQHPDQITDDTLDELYTSPADGQFEFYTLPVDLPAPILTVNPKVKTSTRRAKKTALPLQKL